MCVCVYVCLLTILDTHAHLCINHTSTPIRHLKGHTDKEEKVFFPLPPTRLQTHSCLLKHAHKLNKRMGLTWEQLGPLQTTLTHRNKMPSCHSSPLKMCLFPTTSIWPPVAIEYVEGEQRLLGRSVLLLNANKIIYDLSRSHQRVFCMQNHFAWSLSGKDDLVILLYLLWKRKGGRERAKKGVHLKNTAFYQEYIFSSCLWWILQIQTLTQ